MGRTRRRHAAWLLGLVALAACGSTATSGGGRDTGGGTPDAGSASSADSGAPPPPNDSGSSSSPDSGVAPDASPLDAAPEVSGPTSVQLPIPPRTQWNNANGYCGETSIQSIALYYGTWVSEDLVRTLAGGELLIGVNGPQALTALHFDFTQWNNAQAQPQFQSFMLWMKTYLLQGTPSFFGAYLTDGNNDPDYDHIMPVTGVVTANPAAYDPTDVFTWNDNFGDQIMRAASAIVATRASCSYSSVQGGCIPQNVDYGIAVTGIVDPQHVTLPVSLTVAQSSEPNVSQGDPPVQMAGNVTVSGLATGSNYALLRYDDYTQVPTNATAAQYLASSPTYRVDFTAGAAQWTYPDPNTFTSGASTTYRCVAR
jgi:hypothetical protein